MKKFPLPARAFFCELACSFNALTRIVLLSFASVIVVAEANAAQPTQEQLRPLHLNPAIAKWAEGKPAIGVSTEDYSMEAARIISRSGADYVRLEMEHQPFNAQVIQQFLISMIDKAAILKRGDAQLPIAPIVRIPPYGRNEPDAFVKQALDQGVMGIKFPTINNKAEALRAVRSMRYPAPRGSKYPKPEGLRGIGSASAEWFWGISSDEYFRRADLWPLNPNGDLVSVIMIESAEGLKNVDEIASVPGVSVLFVGNRGDLPASMGVPSDSPEIEAGLQRVLQACKKYNVVCGLVASSETVTQRVKEGWRYIDIGRATGGLAAETDAGLKAGRAAAQ